MNPCIVNNRNYFPLFTPKNSKVKFTVNEFLLSFFTGNKFTFV